MLAHQHHRCPSRAAAASGPSTPRPPSLLLGHASTPRSPADRRAVRVAAAPRDPFSSAPPAATTATPSSSSDLPHDLLPASMQPYGRKTWTWRGRQCSFITAGCGPPVVLVHGFGASATQWRRLFTRLVDAGYKVYAPDLLGFGASDMPLPEEANESGSAESSTNKKHYYRLELWRDQLSDFCREFVGSDENAAAPVLIGNSVGSLTCLMAAAGPVRARGVVLLNTAGALNNKGVVSDWRIVLALPIFLLVDLLLSIRPIARALFDRVRDPESLSNVLKAAYGDEKGGEAVDDELVRLIAAPATRPGALDVFVDVVTSPHYGPKPWDLVPEIRARGTSLLVAWGTEDKLTPVDGPVGKYFRALGEEEAGEGGVTFALLDGHGHCPHDDPRPTLAKEHLLPWLERLPVKGVACEEEEAVAAVRGAAS